jgi:hypothetical protein
LHLRLLKLSEEFVFKSLQLEALLLEAADLMGHLVGSLVDFKTCISSLHLNEVVLLLQSLLRLLPDLLLAVLGVVVAFLPHAVQVVFHGFLLATDFLNCSHFLVSEVSVAD